MTKKITLNLQEIDSIVKDYEVLKELIYETSYIISQYDKTVFLKKGTVNLCCSLGYLNINEINEDKVLLSDYDDTYGYEYYSFPTTYLTLDKDALIQQIKTDASKKAKEKKKQETERKKRLEAALKEEEYKRYLELEAKYGNRKEQ